MRQCNYAMLIGVLLGCGEAQANERVIDGRVVAVADGDTLTVLASRNEQVKVRLAEIDAPEKAQPFGKRSKQSLSELAYGKDVRIHVNTKDRYGRIVGRVLVGELDVCMEQVRRGLAWVYRQYAKDAALFELEAKAKASQRGLWADKEPVPPWEWRRGKRSSTSSTPGTNPKCGTKTTCRQMLSCDEARFYLTECGLSRLDGNGDGVPCEGLCR